MVLSADRQVGRDAELGQLAHWLGQARAGHGRLILLGGRPGIGKSRLCQELLASLPPGVRSGWGASPSGGMAPPLWPWERALRGLPAADQLAVVGRTEHGPQLALRQFADLADAVAGAAGTEALLLVLEDLHWADSASIDLLRHLLVEMSFVRLMVVATYRPDTPGPLADRMGYLMSEPASEVLQLRPLRDEDAATLVRARLPEEDEATVRAICASAAGNPLFLNWLTAAARTGGAVATDGEQTHFAGVLAGPFLTPLDPAARALVDAAAVGGMEIAPALLAQVAEVPLDEVKAMADGALASGLLSLADPITFAHDLLRETVLTMLSPAQRSRWHARWAAALERLGGDAAASAIARHIVACGDQADGDRAATWATRAAAAAAAAGAWEEEADLRRLACTALHRIGALAVRQVEAEVSLATALYRAGLLAESVAVSASAMDAAVSAGLWDVATLAAGIATGVNDADSRAALDRMATSLLARTEISERDRARLLVQQAFHRSGALSPSEDIRLGEQALAVARSAGDPLATLEACRLLVAAPRSVVDLEQRVRLADEAIAASRQLGDPLSLMWPVLWRIEALLVLGRPFRDEMASLVSLADVCRLPLVRWHALRQQAALAAAEGRMTAARAHHAAATAIARQIGDRSAIGIGQAFLPTVMALLGVAEPLSKEDERYLLLAPRDNLAVLGGHAWRLAGADRPAEARALLEQLSALLAVAEHDGPTEGGMTLGLLTAIRLGDRPMTLALRDALARCAPPDGGHGTPTVVLAGAVANRIGEANEALGSIDLAIDDYELAVVVDTRTGMTVPLVQAHLGAARCLICRGQPGDRDRAAGHLGRASAWLEEMEVESLSAELLRLQALMNVGGGRGLLSSRESQVAALVAEGLSNRRIAEQLVLSERTVESHIRNTLIKLDYGRREEIVAWVIRGEARQQ